MQHEKLDLVEFLPETIVTGEGNGKEIDLHKQVDAEHVALSYMTSFYNGGWNEHSVTIPRFIDKDIRTFEVFGLLQAEMGKTMNGNFSFSNCEPRLINYVMKWFKEELELDYDKWRWSVKINIQEPKDVLVKDEIEKKVIEHWLDKTDIILESGYPKKVTYVEISKHTTPYDHGTLVLEYRRNLYSQIIKHLVRLITYEKIIREEKEFIRGYMRGIIAGEGCVNYDSKAPITVFILLQIRVKREKFSAFA